MPKFCLDCWTVELRLWYTNIDPMSKTYTAVMYRDAESGTFVASVPALPGVFTCADSLAELRDNLREAVELMLEDLAATGDAAVEDVSVTVEPIEVAA